MKRPLSNSSSAAPAAMAAKDLGFTSYFKVQFLSSAGASAVSAILLTPLDVIKTRMQTTDVFAAPAAPGKVPSKGVCSFFPTFTGGGANQRVTMSHMPMVERLCYLCGKELQPAGMPINTTEWSRRPLSTTVCLAVEPHGGGSRSIYGVVRDIVKYEGVRALWKGTGPSLAMAIPQVGIYMSLYDRLKADLLASGNSLALSSACAGSMARMASSSVTSPLELVRTRLQANTAVWGKGVHAECEASARTMSGWVMIATRALSQAGGVSALWQGLGPTLWRDVPFSAIYWLVAEETRSAMTKMGGATGEQHQERLGGVGGRLHANLAAGVVGGTAASLCTHPFDVIKTASQVRGNGEQAGRERPAGTYKLGMQIVKERGAGHLFAGIVPRLLKVAPSCAIVLASYETLKSVLSS
jgi:solute carrier family 25 protein 39/40